MDYLHRIDNWGKRRLLKMVRKYNKLFLPREEYLRKMERPELVTLYKFLYKRYGKKI